MARCSVFSVVASLLFLLATPVVAQEGAGRVEGVVVDGGGAPAAGARVDLERGGVTEFGTLTAADGRFAIVAVRPGHYTLRVGGMGYAGAERSVDVSAGETARLEIVIAAAPIDLEGVQVVGVARGRVPVAALPGAVTVITDEELAR